MTQILLSSLSQLTLETHRSQLDESRVRYFTAHPDEIHSMLVYENQVNGERILVNGHHRAEAARRLGWFSIEVDVEPGDQVRATQYKDCGPRSLWSEIGAED